MPLSRSRLPLRGLAFALLVVGGTFFVRLGAEPWLAGRAPYLPFVLAVLVVATTEGRFAGLFATLLSAALSLGVFVGPATGWQPGVSEVLNFVMFLAVGAAVTWLSHSLRQRVRDLDESDRRLDLAQEAAGAGTWVWEGPGDRLHYSPAMRALFGFSRDEPITSDAYYARVHEDDRERVRAAREAAKTGADYEIEYRIVHPARGLVWILSRGRSVRNVSTGAFRITGVALDITARKDVERALDESRAQLRVLADAVPNIVWSTAPEGAVEYFNERWHEYTGMAPDESCGWRWIEAIHPEDRAITERVWGRSVETGQSYQVMYRIRRSDGAYRWFMGRALPVRDAEGRVTGWFGTCTDVHEDRLQQEQRQALLESERAARAEAERALRQRDELVATLSHELRTPLNAMRGWVHLMRQDPRPETLARGLDVLERSVQTETTLIGDLLDVTRLNTGKLHIDVATMDFAQVVARVVDAASPTADARGVMLRRAAPADALWMEGDTARLEQVVWNLVSNAIKFTPAGGSVDVEVTTEANDILCRVRDSGCGIDPVFLPHVFDRYRQANTGAARSHGGLGLGLAISRHLVTLHGGTLTAESDGHDRGAQFTVRLPRGVARETAPPRPPTGPLLAGRRILIVEDDADASELLVRVLADYGAEVRAFNDATGVVEFVEQWRPDAMVTDIGLPGTDGYELTSRVRAVAGGQTLPVVALTAFARPEDRERTLLTGLQAHLTKPVEPGELVATLVGLTKLGGRERGQV
jgi:PAS domain S-box-containing protein